MDIRNSARGFPKTSPTLRGFLGGEPLEGSGFEAQTPEQDFQFDWSPLTDRSEGGVR